MSANAIETLRSHRPEVGDYEAEFDAALELVETALTDMRRALEHLASPNWHVAPSGRDAREMAAYAAAAVRRVETGQ